MKFSSFSRREFLKLAGLGAGALAFSPFKGPYQFSAPRADQFPDTTAVLGRTLSKLDVKAAPSDSVNVPTVKTLYEDAVVQWERQVVGFKASNYDQRWVQTPDGFIYSGDLQPVRNLPNTPLTAIPNGAKGFWAEVTVPFVDLIPETNPPSSPWAKFAIGGGRHPRLYYSQVLYIDQIRAGSDGKPMYRFNENAGRPAGLTGGGYGDLFWADATAFRPLTADDVSPINPDVDPGQKIVKVDLTYQTLQCFEGKSEVYFCRISSGAGFDAFGNVVDTWSTPLGDQSTWRKTLSIHMSAGTAQVGYDTPAVSWCSFFNGQGVAVHAAFWHNLFGEKKSHGCVNVAPEDAKWIFRWMNPVNTFDLSDIVMQYPVTGTHVVVNELKLPGT